MSNIKEITTKQIRERSILSEKDDLLGHNEKARRFLEYILHKKRPVSVGLFGKLGSGKSVFLNFFKKHARDKTWNIVECDIFRSPENIEEFIKMSIIFDIFHRSKKLRIIRNIITSVLIIVILRFIVVSIKASQFFEGLNFILLITGIFIGIVLPYYSEEIRIKYEALTITRVFIRLLDRLLIRKVSRKQIVIIENLDRLSPDKTLFFLERLKATFVDDESIFVKDLIYVIACDRDVLEKTVEKKYNGQYINARDYLDKLIEFSYEVQDINSYETYHEGNIIKKYFTEKIVQDVMIKKISDIFELAGIKTLRDVKSYIREIEKIFTIEQMQNFGCFEDDCFRENRKYFIENLDKILGVLFVKKVAPELFEFILNHQKDGIVADLCNRLDDIYCKEILSVNPSKVSYTKESSIRPYSPSMYIHDSVISEKVVRIKKVLNLLFKTIKIENKQREVIYLNQDFPKIINFVNN